MKTKLHATLSVLTILLIGTLWNVSIYAEEIGAPLSTEEGVYIPWKDGSINLRIVEKHFCVYFLDANKLIIQPPTNKAFIRWKNEIKKRTKGEFPMAIDDKEPCLLAPRLVFPPYHIRFNILLKDFPKEGELEIINGVIHPTDIAVIP